jgi:hypothetical protein
MLILRHYTEQQPGVQKSGTYFALFTERAWIYAGLLLKVIADYSQHHKVHPLVVKVEEATQPHQCCKRPRGIAFETITFG